MQGNQIAGIVIYLGYYQGMINHNDENVLF